ncbi:MAG: FixH family protein [Geminicoccaceae bacterium]
MARQKKRGWWIPWLFVGFFGIVVAVNVTMIFIAGRSWTGLTTHGAYEKGLAYNENLDAAQSQEELGWSILFTTELVDGLDGKLAIVLRDRDGKPIDDADIEVSFERPTHEGFDFTVIPDGTGEGRYEAEFTAGLSGAWNVHTVVRRGQSVFIHDSREMLR